MADEIDISHGGVIAVDTEVLREASGRIRVLGEEMVAAEHDLRRASAVLHGTSVELDGLDVHATTLSVVAEQLATAAHGTAFLADAYDIAEIRAQAELQAHADPDTAAALMRDANALAAKNPAAGEGAQWLLADWKGSRSEGFMDAPWAAAFAVPPFLLGFLKGSVRSNIQRAGRGRVLDGMPLSTRPTRITVTPVVVEAQAGAPAGIADAFDRVPEGDAQVRVEKYTMPGGEERFVVYAAGTGFDVTGKDPWDMTSNAQLYLDQVESDSAHALEAALAAAGAEPGAKVDFVGYSQGGALVSHAAASGKYDVGVVITVGSPVAVAQAEGVQVIALRHTDDLVSNLAAGDFPGGTGAADSVIVSRETDASEKIPGDPGIAAHLSGQYDKTAELADASGDPRIRAVQDYFAELDQASSMEATDYVAARP